MPRTTLPTNDLLSLVGSGAAARVRTIEPPHVADMPQEKPTTPSEKRVARRTIEPKGKRGVRSVSAPSSPEPNPTSAGRKEKFSCRVSADLADSVRNCVVALSGPPNRLTIDSFAHEAFRRELDRLQRVHQPGKPFAKRLYNPKPGRPVG